MQDGVGGELNSSWSKSLNRNIISAHFAGYMFSGWAGMSHVKDSEEPYSGEFISLSGTARFLFSSFFYNAQLVFKSHFAVLKQTHLVDHLWKFSVDYC